MMKIEYIIKSDEGLHAIPASMLAKTSREYKSNIYLFHGDDKVDMKDLFGIMGLGIKQNMKIRVEADGEDENAAIEKITELLQEM